VAADDLNAPLGQDKTRKQRLALPVAVPQAIAGVLSLFIIIFAAWAMIAEDPFGGEPMAVSPAIVQAGTIDNAPETAISRPTVEGSRLDRPNRHDGPPMGPAQPNTPVPAALPAGAKTVTIIDGTSGKRQEVVIPGVSDNKSAAPEERISEPSRHGPLPKVAQDGTRPADLFARPVKAIPGKPSAPRVAIVVGGLGISAAGTSDALRKLPGSVTLAFAPYGGDLERQVARARADAHELLLQVPMEPFEYPDNDPGPQTLLTSLDAGQNTDRLHWLMSRFQGYVGISNFMGARFTASEQALAPVLRETARRGLIYLDDGSSLRSLASQIAGANNLAFAKADVVIDAVPNPAEVDRALARLETMARERGIAVGVASALPVSVEHIAKWAKAAENQGVLLVPITAAVAKAKSS
jgi:uncharacterized protein